MFVQWASYHSNYYLLILFCHLIFRIYLFVITCLKSVPCNLSLQQLLAEKLRTLMKKLFEQLTGFCCISYFVHFFIIVIGVFVICHMIEIRNATKNSGLEVLKG